jgi:hypothetical protein
MILPLDAGPEVWLLLCLPERIALGWVQRLAKAAQRPAPPGCWIRPGAGTYEQATHDAAQGTDAERLLRLVLEPTRFLASGVGE